MGTSKADLERAGLVYENGAWRKPAKTKLPFNLPAAKPTIRQERKPLLNKLETEFYDYIYAEIAKLWTNPIITIQSLRFKLGNGIWYKPDIVHIGETTWTCYEVKGPHRFRGGIENIKVAAHKYPTLRWVLASKYPDGGWFLEVVRP